MSVKPPITPPAIDTALRTARKLAEDRQGDPSVSEVAARLAARMADGPGYQDMIDAQKLVHTLTVRDEQNRAKGIPSDLATPARQLLADVRDAVKARRFIDALEDPVAPRGPAR